MCTNFCLEIAYYNTIVSQNHIEAILYPILVTTFFILKTSLKKYLPVGTFLIIFTKFVLEVSIYLKRWLLSSKILRKAFWMFLVWSFLTRTCKLQYFHKYIISDEKYLPVGTFLNFFPAWILIEGFFLANGCLEFWNQLRGEIVWDSKQGGPPGCGENV